MENNLVGFLEFLATECPMHTLGPLGKTSVFVSMHDLIYFAIQYSELCKEHDKSEEEHARKNSALRHL